MAILKVENVFVGKADWMATPGGVGPDRYPIDYDGAERHSRLPINYTRWPAFNWLSSARSWIKNVAPAMLPVPMSQGFLPQFDLQVWAQAYGKRASGPTLNAAPGTQSFTRFPNIAFPDLPKQSETITQFRQK